MAQLPLTTTANGDGAADLRALAEGEGGAKALMEMARKALMRSDFDAYLTLFSKADEITHELPRYRAHKALLELGYSAVELAGGGAADELRPALAAGALQALAIEPARPLLLAYAARAMRGVGADAGAQALLAAAQRLDPDAEAVRACRAEFSAPAIPSMPAILTAPAIPTTPAIPTARTMAFNATAQRLAAAAQPTGGLRISLCMIVRDEQEMLERCLTAAAPAVDEIVVLDTGSTDATIAIARAHGATVVERPWDDDFSAARNASLQAASGDWIVWLDADEVLVAEDVERLRALAGETWHEAIYLQESNHSGEEGVGAGAVYPNLRMIRNRPQYRFSGRLHEQIIPTLPQGCPELLHHSRVRIVHYGYLDDVRAGREKSRRNLTLLQAQQADGDDSAFLHFNLGSELFALQDYERCLPELAIAWERVLAGGVEHAGFAPALAIKRARALRAAGEHLHAVDFTAQALEHFPDFTDLVYEQGLSLLELGAERDGEARLRDAIELGEPPARYPTYSGAGSYLPRALLAERHLRRGELEPALALLRWCLINAPDYFYGTVAPFALALSKSGHDGPQIVAEFDHLVPCPSARMLQALACVLIDCHDCESAVDQAERIPVDDQAAPALLVPVLSALLARREFQCFERLQRRFMELPLPLRERRERLAQIYLDAGYLRSAAREWLAVCETAPDVRALVGLAEVALRNGQQNSAAQFATEALKLEPGQARAHELLAIVQA